jgi:MFS family permease
MLEFLAPWRRVARPAGRAARWIVAMAFAIVFFGATLPSPLYPLYRSAFGFGGVTLTLIYAVYVLGNLAALLFFAQLSDQIGRRAVTLPAIGVAGLSTAAFLFAGSTGWLFVARALSGLATGLAGGALTAWIAELEPHGDRTAAAVRASAANFTGSALAPLMAGAAATVASQPLRLPYAVYMVLLVGLAAVMLAPPETVSARIGRARGLSLRPRLGVPKQIRLAFLPPAATAFATFSLVGFYAALIPSMLSERLHVSSPLVAGAVICELFLVSAAAIAITERLRSRAAMLSGLVLLWPSVALLVAAEFARSMPLLIAASGVAGIAAALGYRGSLAVVNRIAPDDRRAEVVSSYLIAMYLGNSLPIIGIGLVSDRAGSLAAHLVFAAVIAAIAAAALALGMKAVPAVNRSQRSR